jgi:cytochrome c oxidase subunit 1
MVGGMVMAYLGGIHHWWAKITGRLYSEAWARVAAVIVFAGFNLTFFPMHWTGLLGMPRRVYTYPADMGWMTLNLLSTIGAYIVAIAVLLFVINALKSWVVGEHAGPNPWGAPSLEWATASPPPPYNFAHIPVVESRSPLWDNQGKALPVVTGLRVDERELLLTTEIDAHPDMREPSAMPTLWPLIAALATTVLFVGSIFTPWAVVYGAIPVAAALIIWFWPKSKEPAEEPVIE